MAICEVCFRHCSLEPGQVGFCGARIGSGSKVTAKNYGELRVFKHPRFGLQFCKFLLIGLDSLSQEVLSLVIFSDFLVYSLHSPSLIQHQSGINVVPTVAVRIYINVEIHISCCCFGKLLSVIDRIALRKTA